MTGYSCVVMERSVLLEMDKVAWAELATARDATGSVLRLALLRSLAKRLVEVRAQLVALSGGAPAEHTTGSGDDRFVTINPAARR